MEDYTVEQISAKMKENGMEFFMQQVSPHQIGAHAHIHDSIEIIFVWEGDFRIYSGEKEYLVRKGDLMLFRSNTIHRIFANEKAMNQYYVLKVKPSLIFELASEKNAIGYVLRLSLTGKEGKTHWHAEELKDGMINQTVERMIKEVHAEGLCKDISLKVCACEIILLLLRDIMRNEREDGIRALLNDDTAMQIYKVIQYIHQNYGEELDARQCGQMVNMSYSYFSRCFKRITGRNFKEYLNDVRISHAERLLVTTELSVSQIASKCGYNNVSYFISVYKSLKGRTPLSNRKLEA